MCRLPPLIRDRDDGISTFLEQTHYCYVCNTSPGKPIDGWGDAKGGCVTFNAGISFGTQTIPAGSAEAGSKIATVFQGTGTAHAMMFAGYNDSVYYTPDRKGAVLLVNSWGTSFGDRGIIWVPYHLLQSETFVHCMHVVPHVPRLEYKVRLQGYGKSGGKEWHAIPGTLQSGIHIVTIKNGNKRFSEKLNCVR